MSGAPAVAMGTMLAARWIVGSPLGVGENGDVYEVEDAQGGRLCAVKILNPALSRGGPAWMTFQAEVRAVSALPADAVARVYDVGTDAKLRRAFVVCERVMFPSLARHVAEHGPLSPATFNQALMTLARALDAMHGASVTHGSIKPQNIFLSAEHPSWTRLTDYGLARLRIAVDPTHAGTPGWAAPELGAGAPLQPSGDLYALGMVAFFALTGMPWVSAFGSRDHRVPTTSTPASTRARELGGAIDPAFDVWFKAALASDPAARYSSATEMARGFASLAESTLMSAQGQHTGPGVATAIARPLVFLHDLPGGTGATEAPASVAHPFHPTQQAMPAVQSALDAQARAFAEQQRMGAGAPAATTAQGVQTTEAFKTTQVYGAPAEFVAAPVHAPAAAPVHAPAAPVHAPVAAYAPPPADGRSAFERASGLTRPQLVVVLGSALVVLGVLAVGAFTLFKRSDAPSTATTAPVATTGTAGAPPPAPSAAAAQPATAEPSPSVAQAEAAPAAALASAAPPAVPEPAVTPEPAAAPEPAVAPAPAPPPQPQPVARQPVAARPAPASAPKPAAKPASAPAKKKCGTFIPCK